MSFSIGSLLPGVIVFVVLYFVYSKFIKKGQGQENKEIIIHNSKPVTQTMTLEELAEHDGVKKPTVYIALQNLVFDASSSKAYRPGGSYAKLAGKDCSIALARMSMDEKYLNCYDTYKPNFVEKASLQRWVGNMKNKYKIVARIEDSKKND